MLWIENIIEVMFTLGLFINALLFLPQIIKLIKVKNAQGLSLLTFGGFSFINFFVMLHGFLHKDYLLLAGYTLSFTMCFIVTLLIIAYKVEC